MRRPLVLHPPFVTPSRKTVKIVMSSRAFLEGPNTTNVWRYNALTNVWTKRANIPAASQGPAGAFLNGKIYVATGDGAANAFYIYDVATDVWSAGPARPGVADSYGAAAGAYKGKVFIVGGGAAGPHLQFQFITLLPTRGPPDQLRRRRFSWLAIRKSGNTFT